MPISKSYVGQTGLFVRLAEKNGLRGSERENAWSVRLVGASVRSPPERFLIKHEHLQTILSSSDDPSHVATPGVHQIASLLKRWLPGTHQGSLTMEHLQLYLEEFPFRFHHRTSHGRGRLFRRLLEQAVATHPVTEADILHGYHWNSDSDGKNEEELTYCPSQNI